MRGRPVEVSGLIRSSVTPCDDMSEPQTNNGFSVCFPFFFRDLILFAWISFSI